MLSELRSGVGRVSLTPAIGASLVGFKGRASGCTSIQDDLYATALVLDSGGEQMAILSCDLLAVHPDIVAHVRDLVRTSTGIPADRVAICCSHTHSGPPGHATAGSHRIDQAYAAYLPYLLAGAVRLAHANLTPSPIGHGATTATIGINRREVIGAGETILGNNPDGPVDAEVGVLRVDDQDGVPLATLINYACHPVILGPGSTVVSADFVGRTREIVEAETGAPMLFLQGACGDINPMSGVTDDYAHCISLGTVLGTAVMKAHSAIATERGTVKLAAHKSEVELPLRPLSHSEAASPAGAEMQEVRDREFPWGVPTGEVGPRMEIQVLALADLGLVMVAAEPFAQTGMVVKSASPWARTFFVGYANGCIGYVPTADAYPNGGYEVNVAHLLYGLPAPVAPQAESMLVQACTSALGSLARPVSDK
ncbi:MAG: neutral/alkaline non-lysosomal ceramidase N-terminal domain-containing protein [Chloroflexota bacterium]|nr:neutral/alkaline non-lysosomal ceramidase N-terminal domain-containing protein [Chloroflexota bacterium]